MNNLLCYYRQFVCKDEQSKSSSSGRQISRWKYTNLQNGKDLNTLIYIFWGKVTKQGIYRHKQHFIGGYKNIKNL